MVQLTFAYQDEVEQLEIDLLQSLDEVDGTLRALFPSLPQEYVWICDGHVVYRPSSSSSSSEHAHQLDALKDHSLIVLSRPPSKQQPSAGSGVAPRARPSSSSSLAHRPKKQRRAVYFPGMGFEDVLHYNPNPLLAVQVLRAHPEVIKEMGFHYPGLAQKIATAASLDEAAEHLREVILASEFARSMKQFERESEEADMQARLAEDANDAQAKQYFAKRDNDELLRQQDQLAMQEYPETLFPVLMLYISTEINQVPIKAFVDSGAQTSVMTLACAQRCGIDHLIDARYATTMVGVGQSRTMGRVMICPIKIGSTFFQMSVTVTKEMGDKNMEFLFGLDMLKRHKFVIDLEQGQLTYHGADGVTSTPFLHEKDLPMSRGGTQGLQIDEYGMRLGGEEEDYDEMEEEGGGKKTSEAAAAPPPDAATAAPPPVVGAAPKENNETDEFERKVASLVSKGYAEEAVRKTLQEQNGDVDSAEICLMFTG